MKMKHIEKTTFCENFKLQLTDGVLPCRQKKVKKFCHFVFTNEICLYCRNGKLPVKKKVFASLWERKRSIFTFLTFSLSLFLINSFIHFKKTPHVVKQSSNVLISKLNHIFKYFCFFSRNEKLHLSDNHTCKLRSNSWAGCLCKTYVNAKSCASVPEHWTVFNVRLTTHKNLNSITFVKWKFMPWHSDLHYSNKCTSSHNKAC